MKDMSKEGWEIRPGAVEKDLRLVELRLAYSYFNPNSKTKPKGIIEAVKANPVMRRMIEYDNKTDQVFKDALSRFPQLLLFIEMEHKELLHNDLRPANSSSDRYIHDEYHEGVSLVFYLPHEKEDMYRVGIESFYWDNREKWERARRERKVLEALYIPGSPDFLGFEKLRERLEPGQSFMGYAYYNQETMTHVWYALEKRGLKDTEKLIILSKLQDEYGGDKYKSIFQNVKQRIEDLNAECYAKIDEDYSRKSNMLKSFILRLVSIIMEERYSASKVPPVIFFNARSGVCAFSPHESKIFHVPEEKLRGLEATWLGGIKQFERIKALGNEVRDDRVWEYAFPIASHLLTLFPEEDRLYILGQDKNPLADNSDPN